MIGYSDITVIILYSRSQRSHQICQNCQRRSFKVGFVNYFCIMGGQTLFQKSQKINQTGKHYEQVKFRCRVRQYQYIILCTPHENAGLLVKDRIWLMMDEAARKLPLMRFVKFQETNLTATYCARYRQQRDLNLTYKQIFTRK